MSVPLESAAGTEPSLKKRVANSAIWISIEMAGVQGTSFAVFAAMAHFIVPRDFGLISICFLALQSLQMLVLYNVATVAVRKQRATDLDYTTTFWITIGLSAICFLILLAATPFAERLFHAPGLRPVLQAMSVIILFMGLSRTHETWMMRHFRFKSMAIRGLAAAIIGGAFGLILAVRGAGVDALVGQQIATSVLSVAFIWIVCPWRPTLNFCTETAADIFRFLYQIMPNSAVYAINQNCDTFLVALVFGPVGAGYYNVGKRIRLALQLVASGPIKSIALPSLAEIQNDPQRLQRGALNSLQFLCVICAPAFFGASAVAHVAVVTIFGPNWINAGPIMETLTVGGLAIVLLNYNENIFLLRNKPFWCLVASLAYSVLTTILVIVFVSLHIHAIALPFVLPYLAVFPLSATLASRCLDISFKQWLDALLPGISSALFMFVMVQICDQHLTIHGNIARLLVLCLVGGMSYALALGLVWRRSMKMVIETLKHARGK
jgi:O-antigen/teichoic acid export membrane protein